MNLIRTSLLNGIAVLIKILTLLGLNKILAMYIGPSGYASIGQFQNAIQIVTTFASGAINNGVIKFTAEYHNDKQKQLLLWQTAGTISLIGSIFLSALVIVFSKSLAIWFLEDKQYQSVFIWFGLTLTLFVLNNLFLAILNGKKEVKRLVIANIAGSLSALLVTSILTVSIGLIGALIALAIYQSIAFFISLLVILQTHWFRLNYLYGKVEKDIAIKLVGFTAMALTSACCIPVSHILIRNHLSGSFGWEYAGYWEAMWRLSSVYLMFITTTLSVYYLPKLSELKKFNQVKAEVIQGYKIILPFTVTLALIIYSLRVQIIKILFTDDFIEMEPLFFWQLVGDVFKIGSWILAYIMLSKAMTKTYIISEIIFAFSFYVAVIIASKYFGFEGVSMSYAVIYFCYWILMWFVIKDSLIKDQ